MAPPKRVHFMKNPQTRVSNGLLFNACYRDDFCIVTSLRTKFELNIFMVEFIVVSLAGAY